MLEGYHSFQTINKKTNRLSQVPIWSQLPHQPDHFFQDFHLYLTNHERKPQSPTTDNHALQKAHQLQTGAGKAQKKASAQASAIELDLQDIYIFYYWEERARSYDILQPVAAARLRDQRYLEVEDKQFKLTQRLIEQLETEIETASTIRMDGPGLAYRPRIFSLALTLSRACNALLLDTPPQGRSP